MPTLLIRTENDTSGRAALAGGRVALSQGDVAQSGDNLARPCGNAALSRVSAALSTGSAAFPPGAGLASADNVAGPLVFWPITVILGHLPSVAAAGGRCWG